MRGCEAEVSGMSDIDKSPGVPRGLSTAVKAEKGPILALPLALRLGAGRKGVDAEMEEVRRAA